ncbi:myo-inositol-1(or 4)-monophosphatase [Corynebacterium timonense]|uniref:Inositol-1-monophosphatase n=2 Tax=Corynebacterium timonense TaxID=441500 RepID=A0A1H1NFK0_9CORY|nr:myo-inositol-1(or 4)-monophosphatase [Corynebacterium timonense]
MGDMDEGHQPSPTDLLDICVTVAGDAAALVANRRSELVSAGRRIPAETKSSAVDPVTDVDRAAEAFIVAKLRQLRPHDGLLGEEGTQRAGTSGVEWIIDPIDGTVNFLYGLPSYAVSLAAAVGGRVVVGCVNNVATGESYRAVTGLGSYVEREGRSGRLRAAETEDVAHALVATGFSYSARWRAAQAELLARVLPEVRDIRRMGSAALDLCAVAEGRVDAYYEHGTHPWDWAAGALIATEAGAAVRHPGVRSQGSDGDLVVAAAPGISESFYSLLDAAGARSALA